MIGHLVFRLSNPTLLFSKHLERERWSRRGGGIDPGGGNKSTWRFWQPLRILVKRLMSKLLFLANRPRPHTYTPRTCVCRPVSDRRLHISPNPTAGSSQPSSPRRALSVGLNDNEPNMIRPAGRSLLLFAIAAAQRSNVRGAKTPASSPEHTATALGLKIVQNQHSSARGRPRSVHRSRSALGDYASPIPGHFIQDTHEQRLRSDDAAESRHVDRCCL